VPKSGYSAFDLAKSPSWPTKISGLAGASLKCTTVLWGFECSGCQGGHTTKVSRLNLPFVLIPAAVTLARRLWGLLCYPPPASGKGKNRNQIFAISVLYVYSFAPPK